ncbi:MAG: peptide chain release factor 1 [Candidatus Omnitrophica bacterium CG23_combo_of_CG06-09_8_20_14_all_41_10]|uniref:Peptide chain release factor 1 n=1 Tax=Candidatus Sherwoodlollariibacterium unditelluris TaxID=1974757 RepID=A0A2G9YL27_9BACT|nr:MAG: peptide chain release factor 1 [Candidatus Omnitrophica bacterium CG23_combo_of_CG06-09_8_20_14_all_41_10]
MFEQLKKLESRYNELEQLLSSPEVFSDREKSNKLAKELSEIKEPVSLYREYKKILKESESMEAMLKEKHDPEFLNLAKEELKGLKVKQREVEEKIKAALTEEDKDADRDIIVEIRQGTGGDEAGLFAADLYRMYTKYAARKGWTVEFMSAVTNESGGFKEVSFAVKGKAVYKRLKLESGVHRVQRVPTTEAQGRIHTSTATVAILVEPEEVDLIIQPADLRIDTYRSSGPGGQHMQKTDSAVRVTHLPTGVVVVCQDERSQLKNKKKAMRILRAKLLDAKKEAESKKLSQERKSQIGSGDRSEKIRTYNFPDRRITDHRINFTTHRLEDVLEG